MHKQSSLLHKRRKGTKNSLLLDELIYTGDHRNETKIHLTTYDADQYKTRSLNDFQALPDILSLQGVSWLHITGLSDTVQIGKVGKILGLHRMDVQDILTSQHIAKVESYDDKTMLMINTFYYSESGELQQEHICFILGPGYVISFQESTRPLFENLVKALEQNISHIRAHSADYLFIVLINNILSNYIEVIAGLEDTLEIMEDEISGFEPKGDFGNRIQCSRRDYLLLKKSILPIKDDFSKLIHNENGLIQPENLPYLVDLQDRIAFIIQSIEICRETLSSLLDLYLSNNGLRMNDIMRRLTLVATIFIPLTFVVGVWGMNFRYMPELDWKYGYLVAWGIMLLIGGLVWWYIKKKRWS